MRLQEGSVPLVARPATFFNCLDNAFQDIYLVEDTCPNVTAHLILIKQHSIVQYIALKLTDDCNS